MKNCDLESRLIEGNQKGFALPIIGRPKTLGFGTNFSRQSNIASDLCYWATRSFSALTNVGTVRSLTWEFLMKAFFVFIIGFISLSAFAQVGSSPYGDCTFVSTLRPQVEKMKNELLTSNAQGPSFREFYAYLAKVNPVKGKSPLSFEQLMTLLPVTDITDALNTKTLTPKDGAGELEKEIQKMIAACPAK